MGMKINDSEKTVVLDFDPFDWPIESYVEKLTNCHKMCREGMLIGTLCDDCQDALSSLLKSLQRTCPVCGGNCSVKVFCEEHE